jgi:hypothetical protein
MNDVFSQIEKCCRYADLVGRTVIVDTAYPGIDFGMDFSQLFYSRQKNLLLSMNLMDVNLDELTVFPGVIKKQLNTYQAEHYHQVAPYYVESQSKETLTFDFQQTYSEAVLLNHQLGGWSESHMMFLRLGVNSETRALLAKRLKLIGGDYVGLHVRDTDYQTNYKHTIAALKQQAPAKLFLATDSRAVLDFVQGELSQTKIYSFARYLSVDGRALHLASTSDVDPYLRNQDAIIDLLMLALARHLVLIPLAGRQGRTHFPQYSGYSQLAKRLHQTRIVLNYFFMPLSQHSKGMI